MRAGYAASGTPTKSDTSENGSGKALAGVFLMTSGFTISRSCEDLRSSQSHIPRLSCTKK